MENRNIDDRSWYPNDWPKEDRTKLWYVALFGKKERSAATGGCKVVSTLLRLYAQYSRKGALTTGMSTCSSRPVDTRGTCVCGAIYARRPKSACGKRLFNCVTRSGFRPSCPGRVSLSMPASRNGASVTGPTIGIRYS